MSAGNPPFLDAAQILPRIYDPDKNIIGISNITGQLVPEIYDTISLTYYNSGPASGEIQTASYYQGGLSGTLVATLILSYNGSGQISSVVRT